MKNHRYPALALAGALTLSLTLAACGPKEPEPTPEATPTPDLVESVTPSETPDTTPEAQPTESMTVVSPEESGPVVKPLETQKPAEPSQEPAPSDTPAESSKVQAVWTAIEKRELPAFQDLDDDLLSDFYGVDPADLVEYVCKIPFMNTQATEFFIAQVQPGKLDTVKAALEARQATLNDQWSQYLPDQLELVKNYKLVTSGDYIFFAVTEYADDVVNDFNNNVK